MKSRKTRFSLIMTLAFFYLSVFTVSAQQRYSFDLDKSTVTWTGKKVTGEHTGNVKIMRGMLTKTESGSYLGTFAIDMRSMTCTDIENEEYNAKLVGHLKSDDFFSTEKFQIATLSITGSKPLKSEDGMNQTFTADLTIKGITNSITFPAKITTPSEDGINATAKIVIDRTKWDIRYGSGSFFEDLGDKTIYDDFELVVNLVSK